MSDYLDSVLGKKKENKSYLDSVLGVKPSTPKQSILPTAIQTTGLNIPITKSVPVSTFGQSQQLTPTLPTPSIEEQRMQRDIRATGVSEPEIILSGNKIMAEQARRQAEEKLSSLGYSGMTGTTIKLPIPKTGVQASFQKGFASSFLPSSSTTEEAMRQSGPLGQIVQSKIDENGSKIAETGGALYGTALQYALVGSAMNQAAARFPSLAKFGSGALGKLGITSEPLKKFIGQQGLDLLIDNVVQLPTEVIDAVNNDKTLPQDTVDILKRNMVDMAFNLAIGGTGEMLKKLLKSNDQVINQSLQESLEKLPANQRASLMQEIQVEPVSLREGFQEVAEQQAKQLTPQVPTRVMEAKIEAPPIPETASINVAIQEPIDPSSLVLTEVPKRAKQSLVDTVDRIYQEVVSKNVPFERIGGLSQVQASNLNRLQGAIEYNIIGKQTDLNGREIGKGVAEIFADVPTNQKKDLFEYAYHKHNIDRFKQDKPVFGPSIDSDFSAARVAELDAHNPLFAQKQQEIANYFSNLLDEWGVKSGLTSEETSNMLKSMYENYVPTYRAKDIPKSMANYSQNVGKILKKAKGSESKILPLDQQMIAMTERFVRNAKRNELMNTIANAFEAGDSMAQRYIKEIKGGEKTAVDGLLDVGANMDVEPIVKGNDYVVNFYKNGEPRQMVVNRTLYKALEDSRSDQAINKIASTVKKYATQPFKNLITGYNPIFAASNIMRDVPTALVYSSNPVKMSANVPDAVKEMITNGENFKLFKAMGGTREGLIGSGKTLKVPTLGEGNVIKQAAEKANPIKAIGDVNNFTETLPRFSEFLTVLKETGDPALAVYKSAELTTDFSRHGNLTKLVDNFVPYLNPSVQGIDKFLRSFKQSPIKTAIAGGSVITVPSIALDQYIQSQDKYKDAFNSLSPRERNLYFQVPFTTDTGEVNFVRIPKSRELGVAFSSLAEWALRASRGEEVTGEEIRQAIKENFTPADITSLIWTPALKAWKQIKEPEAYETNYWGGLIVPESQRRYSPGEQYDINSSGIAKAIGKEFNISPYVVDYLIKSYTGIIGQAVQPIGQERQTSIIAPVQRKFITDPVFKSDYQNKFYELLNQKKKEAQDFNKQNNVPSKVVTPLEREANAMNKVSNQISDLRKQLKQLQTEKGKEQQIRELQKAINDLAQKTYNQFK